ncbi:ATP-binding protein [Patescibacteria group bacterium]|nr:ATP-binding protein [Patescibacteria group bacterium]
MIKRAIVPRLKKIAREYGVVSVTGPRQSGKTTLVRDIFPRHRYVNLEFLADLETIKEDPAGFIDSIENGVIIDEIQRFPDLLSYIQVSIDSKYKAGKFIITGSQNLLLSEKISQSLAGRVGILKLLPLTIDELKEAGLLQPTYLETILTGFYPGIYDKKRTANIYYSNYLNTYVERDVRNIKNIGDLSAFNRFLQLLAGRVGQLVNLSELGGLIGVNYKTIDSWLSVLEASYVIFKLEPYYKNFGKRIIKSSKVYFTDVGLAAYLLRLDSVNELRNHFSLGGLFENMIILDIYKRKLNSLSTSKFYYFRDSKGVEIDLLIDKGGELLPIEIKASATFNGTYMENIKYFNELSGNNSGYLIYTGRENNSIRNFKILNYKDTKSIKL